MRAFWLLSSYSSRHASQTKSATGRLAANRVIGCAPQLGQNSEAATHPSVSTRAFCDALSNTAASSRRPRCAQGATSDIFEAGAENAPHRHSDTTVANGLHDDQPNDNDV